MNIQMIAMDLDGTALRPDHLTISTALEQALKQAHEKGIYIVPVSGRPYRLLPAFLLEHPIWESYGILCNGAQIRNMATGEITAHFPMEKALLRQVLEIIMKYNLPVEFNSDGRLYLTHWTLEREQLEEKMKFHCEAFIPRHGVVVETLDSCCDLTVEKVHINCIPQALWNDLEKDLRALDVSVVCEKPPNLEVTHCFATKGQGLKSLCKNLGISTETVMALGDSGNDLSMLETAGFSVAMGSAPKFIKAASDYVTGTNMEDGAAEAICRFAL